MNTDEYARRWNADYAKVEQQRDALFAETYSALAGKLIDLFQRMGVRK